MHSQNDAASAEHGWMATMSCGAKSETRGPAGVKSLWSVVLREIVEQLAPGAILAWTAGYADKQQETLTEPF
jgi:hypothetical protein